MNDFLLFLMGIVVGIITLVVISCISISFNQTPHNEQSKPLTINEQHKQFVENFHSLNSILFIILVCYMGDYMNKETVINYITNAIKIGVNKNWITLKQDDVQIYDCAESLYESIVKTFEEGDI